ncbi:MAG: hypothetical protein VKL39_24310 [Leptolyngbyaceae bacterium]|nr:hypothetical protein [Leptolyngbyaceae bacterium]
MAVNPVFPAAAAAMEMKSGTAVAANADKWMMQGAADVLASLSLDDAKAFGETKDGGAVGAVLDHLARGWMPRKEAKAISDYRFTTAHDLAAKWMPGVNVRGKPDHEVVEMLKDAADAPRVPAGQTGMKAIVAVSKFGAPLPGPVGLNVMNALSIGMSQVFADFTMDEAKRFAAGPHGDILLSAFDAHLTTQQLKQMGKRWGLKMGATDSHTKFARRLREAVSAPSESTPEPAPSRRRGRRAAAPEPTPESAPKKRGGRKAADHAWQPVEGKPGRRKRKLPSGRWHYEDVPLQKAGERRGAYLMRVLRWHLEQMREVV